MMQKTSTRKSLEMEISQLDFDPAAGDRDIRFTGQILDNVHGFISYTPAEKALMNTQLFKRLQSIKQLSVVNWVFPGSEHTRYIHSLGVMHIADKMAISLGLENRERRILRLAGLLHDIGHYPMSHVGEFPYDKDAALGAVDDDTFCREINEDIVSKINGFSITPKTTLMSARTNMHHEAVGGYIVTSNPEIRKILIQETGDPEAPEVVEAIITGNVESPYADPLLVQIMHSELDADGIDYLMRDSAFAGTNFGSCEIDQLIRCLVVGEKEGKRILCVKPKGIAAADQYLMNKFFHYSQVVFNRHIVISEWMAEQVINWMRQHSAIFPSSLRLRQWANHGGGRGYLAFTDNLFWTALDRILANELLDLVPHHIRTFCEYLLGHNEPQVARETELRIVSNDETVIREALQKSEMYNNENLRTGWITTMVKRTMSSQVPEKVFDEQIEKELRSTHCDYTREDVPQMKLSRLMEGICIRENEEDTELHLLCDDPRSLMQQLYNSTVVILRSYEFPRASSAVF